MNKESKQEWIKNQLETYKSAKEEVICFIADFLFHEGDKQSQTIKHLFSNGYCYYFAKMLQIAFERGTVCFVYGQEHFVWLDDSDQLKTTTYDINGVNKAGHYIQEDKILKAIPDFKHIRGKQSELTESEFAELQCLEYK